MAAVSAAPLAPAACRAAAPAPRRSQAASSSQSCCRAQSRRQVCSRVAAPPRRAPPRRSLVRAAADDEAEPEEEEEEEEEDEEEDEDEEFGDDEPDPLRAMLKQPEEQERRDGEVPFLRRHQQWGLRSWQPATTTAPQERAGGAGEAGAAPEAMPSYDALLRELPGLQRQLRVAAQERVGLAKEEVFPEEEADHIERYQRKPEPELSPWDLRAKMEKRRRQQRDFEAWNERRAQVGQYPSLGADWRSDVRIQGTSNPTDPEYREWTHKEIWDLITLNGRNADPRDVKVWVRDPLEIADAPAQGAEYRMDPEEYFESLGRLMREEDVEALGAEDRDEEVALLASEFSDFDAELAGGTDFDAEYAGDGAAEDGF